MEQKSERSAEQLKMPDAGGESRKGGKRGTVEGGWEVGRSKQERSGRKEEERVREEKGERNREKRREERKKEGNKIVSKVLMT